MSNVPRTRSAHPVRVRGPSGWTTKQLTVVGLVVSAVVSLVAALLPGIIDRSTPEPPPSTRDALDGTVYQVAEVDGLEAEVTSLSHLVVYVTMIDRTVFSEQERRGQHLPRWDVSAEVTVPDGTLELSVPVPWADVDELEDDRPGWRTQLGTQGVGEDSYADGGIAGILLTSRPDDVTPMGALFARDQWPSPTCLDTVPARDVNLDEGQAALQVLTRCETGSQSDDVAWLQLAVDTGERIETIEVTVTSLRDLDALAQMLASLHLTEAASRVYGGL